VIAQAGRYAVVVDVDAFALQNAFEVNYGIEAGSGGAAQCRRERHQHQHPQGDQSVFTRDISIGECLHRGAAEGAEPPFELADQLKTR
jgi:type IV pilus assembly protein PilM